MKKPFCRALSLFPAALILLYSLSGCQSQPENPVSSAGQEAAAAGALSGTDAWDADSAVKITLTGDSAAVEGGGAGVSGSTVTITQAGTYLVSGELADGQLIVDAGNEAQVRLILNNASITSSVSAPLYIKQADKTVLTLADGTENYLCDPEEYADETGDEPDAALFSKNDLTINGGGSLTVQAGHNNGIGCKDDLLITGGSFSVTAKNHGIRGRDSLSVEGGSFTVSSGADALQSNNADDPEKGFILISGGEFDLTAGNDGIQAETNLEITGGDFTIVTGGGASAGTKHLRQGPPGDARDAVEETEDDTLPSTKALKAGAALTVSGGSFSIDACDDAVHSNGDLTVDGGSFTINTGDDGFHADSALALNGGEILLESCYEGLEGATVTINDGSVRLNASDDGINAASGVSSGPGRGDPSALIKMTGGFVSVTAQGDGVDSNGSFLMEGGTLLIHGPVSGGNAPLDFDGEATVNGGILLAAGSSGMLQLPDGGQNTLTVVFSSGQSAGTLLHVEDETGASIATFAPQADYQAFILSSPELKIGGSYTVWSGGSCAEAEAEGYCADGAYTGGTPLFTAVLTQAVTCLDESGAETQAGGFGGRGAGGAGRGRRDETGAPPPEGAPDGPPPMDKGAFPPKGGEFPGNAPAQSQGAAAK